MVRDKREVALNVEHGVSKSIPDVSGVGVGNISQARDVGRLVRVQSLESREFGDVRSPPPIRIGSNDLWKPCVSVSNVGAVCLRNALIRE